MANFTKQLVPSETVFRQLLALAQENYDSDEKFEAAVRRLIEGGELATDEPKIDLSWKSRFYFTKEESKMRDIAMYD